MIYIFGGAYQGMLEYAKEHYEIGRVCDCADGREPDLACDAVTNLDGYVKRCVREGREAVQFFREREGELAGKILIGTDVSCGIVPMDREERAFREMNGRLGIYLAGRADDVIRVFCGLGKSVKDPDSVL